ncbi:MAG: serine/threonine protein kinase [Deltaproteobacteria bacterium]|nr:serine/threonine protein kinase [Deltaproteobacteria bacterium]
MANKGFDPNGTVSLTPEPDTTPDGDTVPAQPAVNVPTIDPRFRVEAILGEGGIGIVYRATQISINRRVAIKVLQHEYSRNPKMAERFAREAESVARLSHPNIVALYDFGRAQDGSFFMVMEYVEGVTLDEEIARTRVIAPDDAVLIAGQILAALEHAHAHGVVHRDLKPANVVLARAHGHRFFAKLLDFGIARIIEGDDTKGKNLTQTGTILGTPAYMAPEQAFGERVDARADVYALGVILYEMLTGERPYTGGSTVDVFLQQIHTPPRPIDPEIARKCADRILHAVVRALAKRPEDRFQSASEMRAALLGESPTGLVAADADGATNRAEGSRGRPATKHDSIVQGELVGPRRNRIVWAGGATTLVAGAVLAMVIAPSNSTPVTPVVAPASESATAPAPGQDFNAKAQSSEDAKNESSSLGVSAPLRQIPAPASAPAPAPASSRASAPMKQRTRAERRPRPRAEIAPATPLLTALTVKIRCPSLGEGLCYANAIVLDDGKPIGAKKHVFDTLPGRHRIQIVKDGHKPVDRLVDLTHAPTTLTIDLEPNP